jgi:hypothetical protein
MVLVLFSILNTCVLSLSVSLPLSLSLSLFLVGGGGGGGSGQCEFMAFLMVFNLWIGPGFIFELWS